MFLVRRIEERNVKGEPSMLGTMCSLRQLMVTPASPRF